MARKPAGEIFPETRARLAEWRAQSEVLGVLLVGSKANGHQDVHSDDDLEVLVTDLAFARLIPERCSDVRIEGEGDQRRMIYDAQLLPLSDLKRKAGSSFDLDHWPYERAQVLFDRDGSVRRHVEAAGEMPADFRAARLSHAALDAWIAVRRSEKTVKRDAPLALRLLAGRGIRALARLVFALEWRWIPLDHWFDAELGTLDDDAGIRPHLIEAIATTSVEPVRAALEALAEPLEREGFPQDRAGRTALFLRLVHPSKAEERARHAVP